MSDEQAPFVILAAAEMNALVEVARAAREMSTLHDYCIVCRFPGGNHTEGCALARLDKEQP